MQRNVVSNLMTGTLTLCALIVTVAVARREFFPHPAPHASEFPRPRRIKDWESLAHKGRLIGPPDAPVKIVEFSDFQCPFCRTLHFTLEELRERYPGQIAVVYRHFPLQIHPHAFAAAIASECAAAQGRFEAYHGLLFARQDSIGVKSWENFAREAAVPDLARFQDCRGEASVKDYVDQDVATARHLGVTGTPAVIIQDQVVVAALPIDSLEAWIRMSHDLAQR